MAAHRASATPDAPATASELDRIAQSPISVLILGETGVGKEVLAKRLHAASPRANGPFVAINCSSLRESLLESELFGHERGSFTGALRSKPGMLETAQGGTVFLDEIGEMPCNLQAAILRMLEERRIQPVGGLHSRPIDVRFIAATNRDLEIEVAERRFRQDLYHRLDGVSLWIPPLRERLEEIGDLARSLLAALAAEWQVPAPRLSPAVHDQLLRYHWPGNVRELRNVLERALVRCDGDDILPAHLTLRRIEVRPPAAPRIAPEPAPLHPMEVGPRTALMGARSPSRSGATRERILAALEQCAGNQTQAARHLGIARRTLVTHLKALGIPRPRSS